MSTDRQAPAAYALCWGQAQITCSAVALLDASDRKWTTMIYPLHPGRVHATERHLLIVLKAFNWSSAPPLSVAHPPLSTETGARVGISYVVAAAFYPCPSDLSPVN